MFLPDSWADRYGCFDDTGSPFLLPEVGHERGPIAAGTTAYRLGFRRYLARCPRSRNAFRIIELPVVGPGRVRSACRQPRPPWPLWIPGSLLGDVRRPAQASDPQAEWIIPGPTVQRGMNPR